MWTKEFDPTAEIAGEEIEGKIGEKDKWYSKQVQYWDVSLS